MPCCSFCDSESHTLVNCTKIHIQEVMQLCIDSAKKGPRQLNECLKLMRLPVLKRLVKSIEYPMNQSAETLRNICFRHFAWNFPKLTERLRRFNAEYNLTLPPNGFNTEAEHTNWIMIRANNQHRIIEEYLSEMRRVGIANIEPSVNHFSLFCLWFQSQTVNVHRYFHMDPFMYPQVRVIRTVQPPTPVPVSNPAPVSKKTLKIELQQGCDNDFVDNEMCAICLETEPYIKTECQHLFCNCLLHHISKYNAKCPLCREEIKTVSYNNRDIFRETMKIAPCLNLNIE